MNSRDLPPRLPMLDRNALARDQLDLIPLLLQDPATRLIAIYDRELAVDTVSQASDEPVLRYFLPDEIPSSVRTHSQAVWIYLGRLEGAEYVALVVPQSVGQESTEQWRSQIDWLGLRELAELADSSAASVALPAVALANWHVTALFCGRCSGSTRPTQSGWVRTCNACGVEHFPRTDSAVIMAITDNADRILLGNSSKWPVGRYSTLAGFVEPGESLEDAVRREVLEESGVTVGEVNYFASQPWPFPASLMLGYFGRALSTDIAVDGTEIREARWFTRTDLLSLVESGEVTLPGRISIARRLIETWLRAAD